MSKIILKGNKNITPNHKIIFDGYIQKAKIAYNEYKKLLIQWIEFSCIGDDGGFIYYDGGLADKIAEKRKAYNKAVEEMNAYKTLYAEYL